MPRETSVHRRPRERLASPTERRPLRLGAVPRPAGRSRCPTYSSSIPRLQFACRDPNSSITCSDQSMRRRCLGTTSNDDSRAGLRLSHNAADVASPCYGAQAARKVDRGGAVWRPNPRPMRKGWRRAPIGRARATSSSAAGGIASTCRSLRPRSAAHPALSPRIGWRRHPHGERRRSGNPGRIRGRCRRPCHQAVSVAGAAGTHTRCTAATQPHCHAGRPPAVPPLTQAETLA